MSSAWTPSKNFTPLSYESTEQIGFGCHVLDCLFDGGLPVGSLTEIVGDSGAGKTQIGLQLALNVQMSKVYGGLNGNALYIYTDYSFPFKRLRQLSLHIQHLPPNPLDKVFVRNINNVDDLIRLLGGVDAQIKSCNIKLIVVDSIASLFRSQFPNTGSAMSRRQNLFFRISSRLKQLATKYALAVYITNQVVDAIQHHANDQVGNEFNLVSAGRSIAPALGLSWSNCVNTRIAIVILDDDSAASASSTCFVPRRQMKVLFAPHLGNPSAEIIFGPGGVMGM